MRGTRWSEYVAFLYNIYIYIYGVGGGGGTCYAVLDLHLGMLRECLKMSELIDVLKSVLLGDEGEV